MAVLHVQEESTPFVFFTYLTASSKETSLSDQDTVYGAIALMDASISGNIFCCLLLSVVYAIISSGIRSLFLTLAQAEHL